MKNKVLLIDKELEYTKKIEEYLITECLDVDIHHDEVKGLLAAQYHSYDIILLDIVTSKLDGFELLKELRETNACPIVVITTRDDHFDHVYSLEIGADDYLLKSIPLRVLRARLNAIIRRLNYKAIKTDEDVISINNITVYQTARKSYYNNQVLKLTGGEFNVLYYLMSFAGKIKSKESIAKYALGRTTSYYDRCIDTHISNIRKKISLISSGDGNDTIKTIRGSGYIFLFEHFCDEPLKNVSRQFIENGS